jgi:hypothetical protein
VGQATNVGVLVSTPPFAADEEQIYAIVYHIFELNCQLNEITYYLPIFLANFFE